MEEGKILKEMELDGKKLVFRAPKSGDAPKLLEYINSLVDEGANILLKEKLTIEFEEKFVERLLKDISSGIKFSVCVEFNGKIIATASVEKNMKEKNANEHMTKVGIAILKEFRQKGLGSMLMNMLIKYAKETFKSEIIRLEVYSDNDAALKLYEKVGFREVGRIPKGVKHKDKYEDEIIMIKEL